MKNFSLLCVLILLGGCASGPEKPILHFLSWNDYYDTSIIEQFEKENNVKIQVDYFANNEEALAKLEQTIANNGDSGYDVFFPSDYVVEYLKNKQLLEKIDINSMPHIKNNILPQLNSPVDPKHEYSIPYAWGSIGIVYNTKYIKTPINSWKDILEPAPEYKGKILMIDSPKEIIGVALKYLGYSFGDTNVEHLKQAEELLKKQSDSVLTYNGDAIQFSMPNEEAYMAVSWTPEARFAMDKNPALAFVIPKEGSNLFMDNLVVMKGTKVKEVAEKFLDFWYRDDIMKKNWDYMHMSVPSKSFFNILPTIEKNNQNFYPTGANFKKLDYNREINDKIREIQSNIYTNIRS